MVSGPAPVCSAVFEEADGDIGSRSDWIDHVGLERISCGDTLVDRKAADLGMRRWRTAWRRARRQLAQSDIFAYEVFDSSIFVCADM